MIRTKKLKIIGLLLLLTMATLYYLSLGSTPTYPANLSHKKTSLRLITQNIAHARGNSFHQLIASKTYMQKALETIGAMLKEYDADIALLQEIDFDAPWTNHVNQLEAIKASSEMNNGYEGNNNISEGFMQHKYGNATLSRIPAELSKNHPFGVSKFSGKGFLYTKFAISGKIFHVINLHLHPYSKNEKEKQLKALSAFLISLSDSSIIIGGDFNMQPSDELIASFMNKHQLTRSTLPESDKPTFVTFGSKRLDFFLHSKNLIIEQMMIIEHTLSDHFGVVIDIQQQ